MSRRLSLALLFLLAACAPRSMSTGDGGTPTDGGVGVDAGPHGDAGPVPDGGAEVFQVEFQTTKGNFVVEVHRSWAPNGADHFRTLVTSGFYDQCRFFRVVSGFMAQFGMNGTPATEAMWSHMTIPDDPVVQSNVRGYVSYAQTTAPNSRTTQLFINFGDNSFLDAMHFAPFGQVISGMDVVDMLDAEYGEMSDQQMQIESMGNAYLTANFPNLDYITTAHVL